MRTGTTDAVGAARVSQLAVGGYQIEVSANGFNGFKTVATVSSGATTTVPIALEIATATQEIVVMETATALNTVNAQLQNSVQTRDITTLPLLSNDVVALAGNAPGVIPVAANNPFLGLGSFNSNGGRGRGNNITVDNATATDVSTTGEGGTGTLPIDAIQEFNVITNNPSAEFGQFLGGAEGTGGGRSAHRWPTRRTRPWHARALGGRRRRKRWQSSAIFDSDSRRSDARRRRIRDVLLEMSRRRWSRRRRRQLNC